MPQNGWLLVETTGFTDTLGTLWDEVELLGETALAEDNDSGTRRNFRIPLRVQAGTYLLAVGRPAVLVRRELCPARRLARGLSRKPSARLPPERHQRAVRLGVCSR